MADRERIINAEQKEEIRRKLRKRRRIIKAVSMITWAVFFISSLALYFTLKKQFGFLPAKYTNLFLFVTLGISLLTFVAAFLPSLNNTTKVLQSVICVLLAALMIGGSVYLPTIRGKMQKIFTPVPEEGEMKINVYVLKDNAKYSDIESLAGKLVGTQASFDAEYQEYAVKVINKEIKGNDIRLSPQEDIYTAVDALYNGDVDAIMLNEDYVAIIADNEDYSDFDDKTRMLYQCIRPIDLHVDTSNISITKEPFVVCICGQDEWRYDYITKNSGFRSDVNILVAVNPNTRQVLMITTPRDSYVPLYGNKNMMDKLTHATVTKGIQGLVSTVSAYYGVDINYYLRVNFTSLVDIVNAMDGIDINNPYKFKSDYYFKAMKDKDHAEYQTITFEEGPLHLDGQMALCYVRERHALKNGDMGRNEHQAIILKACIDKLCSVSILQNALPLLQAVEGKFTSNITMDEIFALAGMQLEEWYDWNLQSYSVTGSTKMAPSYMMGGRDLSMVILSENSVKKAKEYIQVILDGGVPEIAK